MRQKIIKKIQYFDYNSENLLRLNERLQSIDWFLLTQNTDNIDTTFDIIKQKYTKILETTVEEKSKSVTNRKPFNSYIRSLIKQRQRLRKMGKMTIL